MKKRFFLLIAYMLIAATFLPKQAGAQAPQKMSYQAIVRNSSNELVKNHSVGIKISILQGNATGTTVYTETQAPTSNTNGLVTLEIGGGTVLSGTFASIDWSNGPYFLKTETDPTGGTNYTITGTSQLLSVPYALHSKTAESITGGASETDPVFVASPANGITSTDISNWSTAYDWGNHTQLYRPVTWVPTWADVTQKPTFAIVATSGSYNDLTNKPTLFSGSFTDLTNKPTTLSGYGITNAMSTSHVANAITANNIANWNTAFGWGNHVGLYRLIGWVPAWTDVTGKPTFAMVATSGSYNDLTNKPTLFTNVVTDATLAGNGTSGTLLKIAQQAATSGQVLKWNGSTWIPGNDLTGSANTPGGSSGHVQFNNAGSFGGDGNLFWDNTNKRLGIGTNTPAFPLEIKANSSVIYPHLLLTESEYDYARLMFKNTVNPTKNWTIAGGVNLVDAFSLLNFWYWNGTEGKDILSISGSGNVGIGTYTPGAKLEVAGQIKITGGSPANGEVLTSDANGLATWEPPKGGGHYIGEFYGGGIVFYLYDNGQHGLIAATVDQGIAIQWQNGISRITGASGNGVGAGKMNTAIMISTQINDDPTGHFAARVCINYSVAVQGVTYGDWYLPSEFELVKLYEQRAVVGGFNEEPGYHYWSSTEAGINVAASHGFYPNCPYSTEEKRAFNNVRAIRAF